jgi:hypothetical protein
MSKPIAQRSAAVRHLVYADLLSLLRPASMAQAEIMAANLALLRTGKNRIDVLTRFVWLKVSPDLDRGDSDKRRREIEKELAAKYGSRLSEIAGFYFMQDRWRLNLPRRCFCLDTPADTDFITVFCASRSIT